MHLSILKMHSSLFSVYRADKQETALPWKGTERAISFPQDRGPFWSGFAPYGARRRWPARKRMTLGNIGLSFARKTCLC